MNTASSKKFRVGALGSLVSALFVGAHLAGCASAPPLDDGPSTNPQPSAVAPSSSVAAEPPPVWGIFSPKDGAFTAVFPSQPEESVEPVAGPAGKVDTHKFEAEGPGGSAYLVSYTDYPVAAGTPDEIKKRLVNVRDSFIAAAQAKLVSDKEISVGGVQGREFTITMNVPEQIFSHTRVFMRGSRLYQFMAMIPADVHADDDVRTFLDSVALGPAAPASSAPPGPAPSALPATGSGPAAPSASAKVPEPPKPPKAHP